MSYIGPHGPPGHNLFIFLSFKPVKMKRLTLTGIFILLMVLPQQLMAQRWRLMRWEGIAGVGTANYFGDIGGAMDDNNAAGFKDLEITSTRPSFQLAMRYRVLQDVAVKANLMFAFLNGNDENSKNESRGLSFSTFLFEPSIQGEYYIIPEERKNRTAALYNRRGMVNNYSQIALYVFAGVGGTYFKSNLEADPALVSGLDPENFALVFPGGLGLKYIINDTWTAGFELGARYTLTDYIDGYTSDYSSHNDIYYFGVFNATYKFRTTRSGWPILFRKSRGLQ